MEHFKTILGFADLFFETFISFASSVIEVLGEPIGYLLNKLAEIEEMPAILEKVLQNASDLFGKIPYIGEAPLISVMLGVGIYVVIAVWLIKFIISWI